jgi:acyl-CoA synthetase (AMP-forming)/AMP-acid ligase II
MTVLSRRPASVRGPQCAGDVDWQHAADAERAAEVRHQERCLAQTAGFKVPRAIDFRAELPRLPTGKLAKNGLREEYRKKVETGFQSGGGSQAAAAQRHRFGR